MKKHALRILVITATPEEADFATLVLTEHGDEVVVASDIHDAIAILSERPFEMLMMALTLPVGDGLALVHNVRALHPNVDIVVFSAADEIENTSHAVALGVMHTVMLPLTGDALLVAADRAREKRVLIAERHRLATLEASSRRRMATYARCAEFVAEIDAQSVAKRVLEACAGELEVRAGAIYIPLSAGGTNLTRASSLGAETDFPVELDDELIQSLDPTQMVNVVEERLYVMLLGDFDLLGLVLLLPGQRVANEAVQGLEMVAALGVGAFVAAAKVDAIARTGIKDPETSAYTFAYFGDAAGREIGRAARHGRRFALLTLQFDRVEELRPTLTSTELIALRRMISDALLDAVRDSDILARVEDDEFYLLLPETGLLGALAARRRIIKRFDAVPEMIDFVPEACLDPIIGLGMYPADGADLGRLMRRSRSSGDRSAEGVWRRLRLGREDFWEALGRLLGEDASLVFDAEGGVVVSSELERAHDEEALARHVVLEKDQLERIGRQLALDAIRHRVHGNIYIAGDDRLIEGIAAAMETSELAKVRAWALGERDGPGQRIRLPISDPRLDTVVLLVSLTELGGYFFAGRRLEDGRLLGYHSSDLDLVDGMVAALQKRYHLQPGIGQ